MSKECKRGEFKTVNGIRKANAERNDQWFSPDTMAWWSGTVSEKLHGGCMFVSSEKPPGGTRGYTIRVALADGEIESVTELRHFRRKADAENAATCLVPILKKFPEECPSTYHREGEFAEEIEKVLSAYVDHSAVGLP